MAKEHPSTQIVEGLKVGADWNIDLFRSALYYKARPDDIFLVTFPKSGTTWMEVILYGLLNNGEAFDKNMANYFARTPFLDFVGAQGIDNMQRPCVIKTHLPFDRVPYHEKAKYICVIRNIKDVCVSYYNFVVNMPGNNFENTPFEVFFESFVAGEVRYNGYFDHLRSVWKHKDDDNVFLTSYEHMKYNIRNVIRQVAGFINIELTDDVLEKIVLYSSFDYMKDHFSEAYTNQTLISLADESSNVPLPSNRQNLKKLDSRILVRKGEVGGWRSSLTEKQSQYIDQVFTEKTADLHGLNEFFYKIEK
jgi:hypothetical protein